MAFSWLSACLLATVLLCVNSDYDPEVCSFIKESYGLSPPPLPRNFEAKFESYNPDIKSAVYEETYLDYSNERGKYMYLQKGIEHHYLYDYLTMQVVAWDVLHPGLDIKKDPMSHVCTAINMEDSPEMSIFGLEDEMSHFPKMHNSYEMLRYGQKHLYAYNGSELLADRGLRVNNFVGCVYDEDMDATLKMNYTFTDDSVLPSGGSGRKVVVGVDDGLLSVPAQVVIKGVIYDQAMGSSAVVSGTESYFWFKADPEFKHETFRIPPYIYCEGYQGILPMPPLPKAFTTRVQRTDLARDIFGKMVITEVSSYEEVFYYQEKGLARRDFIPNPDLDSDLKNKFQSLEPVKTIFDFNEGIVYVTHKPTGRCYAKAIEYGDFFESIKEESFVKMAEPEEVFFMQTDEMEHKGTDFVRDIECDVWTGKYFDPRFNASFVKETYVSTNGWHEEAKQYNGYGVPIQHTMINQELITEPVEVVSTYSFLQFIVGLPPLGDFDISNCIETIEHKDFVIVLSVNKKEDVSTLFKYRSDFEETAQYYLAGISQVGTPLRVQRVMLTDMSLSDQTPILHFTLVEKVRVRANIPVGQAGSSLKEAESILSGFIWRDQFDIQFYPPKQKVPVTVAALRGSLYYKTTDGKAHAPPFSEPLASEEVLNQEEAVEEVILFSDTEEAGEQKKGLSSGALTGLAFAMLFIGLGIGIAVMYLYIRRYNETNLEDRITLTPQQSLNAESPLPTASTSFEH